jgi:hypothetical protein
VIVLLACVAIAGIWFGASTNQPWIIGLVTTLVCLGIIYWASGIDEEGEEK